jgi:hypothetical protein
MTSPILALLQHMPWYSQYLPCRKRLVLLLPSTRYRVEKRSCIRLNSGSGFLLSYVAFSRVVCTIAASVLVIVVLAPASMHLGLGHQACYRRGGIDAVNSRAQGLHRFLNELESAYGYGRVGGEKKGDMLEWRRAMKRPAMHLRGYL